MALQNQTYANSGDPYYGKPSDWSLFPTLSSIIMFNDTEAVLKVIPAVDDKDTTITFNGEQLAYVSDIPDLADWAQFPANNNVTIPDPYALNAQVANISSITVSTLTVNETNINIINTDIINADLAHISSIVFSTINITADNGVSLFPSAVNINTSNGLYGNVDITANPGLAGAGGGNISLTANGGSRPGGLFGQINITANEGTADPGTGSITTGGYINIQANSGSITSPTLTSRIDLNAGGLNLYSGLLSPIASEFGYTFINASAGVSVVAGNFSPSFQVPGSVYLYGTTGVVLGGDAYAGDIYPRLDNSLAPPTNLNIYGRGTLLGNAFVNINNVDNLNFDVNGETKGITGLSTINGLPLSDFQYDPTPAFSTVTINFDNGVRRGFLETAQIKNTNAGTDLNINQENGTGGVSMAVFIPPSGTATGEIRISDNGEIRLNTMDGEGITINPTGGVLTFQTAGDVATGQINNLSTINAIDVNNPIVTNIRASGTVFTNEIRSQSPNLGSLMRIDLNDDVMDAITLTHPSAPTGSVRIIEASVGPGVLEVGSLINVSSINGLSYPPINFVDNLQFYVAPNGNDLTGTGSQQNPFVTIARALTARALLSPGVEVSIVLASGTYTETFTLLRNTYLVGVPTGDQRQPCNITGNIEMNSTAGVMGIANLQVNGSVSMNGVGGNYSVFGCNITVNGTAIAANSGTVFITESRINNTLGPCITSASTLLLRDCLITTTNTDSCIVAAANLTIRQCVITSSAAPGNAEPLVKFINPNPATIEILFCKLQYLNGSTDTGGNKCCIQFDGASTANASIFDCLLICEGAVRGSPLIECIQDTGPGAVNLSYSGIRAGATANHISPSVIKTQYVAVT